MKLLLKRTNFSDKGTVGEFYIDGVRKYYTMEDRDRKLETVGQIGKIFGDSAIPRGTYKVILDYSPKYGKRMPHVLDVPYFEGIRIHIGNYARDTEGCILIGLGYSLTSTEWMITNSKIAFIEFYSLLESALDKGEEVTLEVI